MGCNNSGRRASSRKADVDVHRTNPLASRARPRRPYGSTLASLLAHPAQPACQYQQPQADRPDQSAPSPARPRTASVPGSATSPDPCRARPRPSPAPGTNRDSQSAALSSSFQTSAAQQPERPIAQIADGANRGRDDEQRSRTTGPPGASSAGPCGSCPGVDVRDGQQRDDHGHARVPHQLGHGRRRSGRPGASYCSW